MKDPAFELSAPAIQRVARTLLKTGDPIDALIGNYLDGLFSQHFYVLHLYAPPPPIEVLGNTVQRVKKTQSRKQSTGRKGPLEIAASAESEAEVARNWGIDFLVELFGELRQLLCGKGKKSSPLGGKSHAALASLGAIVVHKLGIADPTGLGIAVLILLSLARVTKKTLCRMTSPEELKKYLRA
jgi:hypothetical protein